ncbi:MAG: metallophosphoesterase family protein [Dehalococcoidia bacterium]|nr:metallophosphoesterase family protein [Dehalococcoidia bacterium]MDD5493590.1 metallophosphoesterase family protein [Dehalococcoidia bacterium]
MRLGVISDTHLRSFLEMPQELVRAMSQVDLIIHAGDIVTLDIIRGLEKLAPVHAVCGNMDSPEVRVKLPEKQVVEVEGRKIGIVHGYGGVGVTADFVKRLFPDVEAVVFGHTHEPMNKLSGGVLFFNPGRACNSYGVLTVGNNITGEIKENYY